MSSAASWWKRPFVIPRTRCLTCLEHLASMPSKESRWSTAIFILCRKCTVHKVFMNHSSMIPISPNTFRLLNWKAASLARSKRSRRRRNTMLGVAYTRRENDVVINPSVTRMGEWECLLDPLAMSSYYHHSRLKITTDINIEPQDGGRSLELAVDHLLTSVDCEWYCDVRGDWFYINHTKEFARSLLPELEVHPATDPPPGQADLCRSKYWEFVKTHPLHLAQHVPPSALAHAWDALNLISVRHTLDPRSPTLPLSKLQCEELQEILTISAVTEADGIGAGIAFGYRTEAVASILEKLYAQRYWSQHSESNLTDLYRQPVHENGYSGHCLSLMAKYFMRLLYIILLWVPAHYEGQIERARRVRIDKEVPFHIWKEVIEKLKNDWSIFILVAAVLWASTMAGLAIPGIDGYFRLFTWTAGACAFTSIVTGIALSWQYAGTLEQDGMSRELYYERDPRRVACLQAIPLAALLWGLLCFAVALCLFPFLRTDSSSGSSTLMNKPESPVPPMFIELVTFALLGTASSVVIFDVVRTRMMAFRAEELAPRSTWGASAETLTSIKTLEYEAPAVQKEEIE